MPHLRQDHLGRLRRPHRARPRSHRARAMVPRTPGSRTPYPLVETPREITHAHFADATGQNKIVAPVAGRALLGRFGVDVDLDRADGVDVLAVGRPLIQIVGGDQPGGAVFTVQLDVTRIRHRVEVPRLPPINSGSPPTSVQRSINSSWSSSRATGAEATPETLPAQRNCGWQHDPYRPITSSRSDLRLVTRSLPAPHDREPRHGHAAGRTLSDRSGAAVKPSWRASMPNHRTYVLSLR